uniref:Beta-lactamase domain-containing protein n=1 Tax=Caenorhabditis tropicalis TaxID=1561998 RepID=A0A1I7URP0_9PELO
MRLLLTPLSPTIGVLIFSVLTIQTSSGEQLDLNSHFHGFTSGKRINAYPYTAPERVVDKALARKHKKPQATEPDGAAAALVDPSADFGMQGGPGMPGGMSNRLPPLQTVHPPAPNEKDWVLTAGNESLVDNVLAISLQYGGRLVSMGYYLRGQDVNYYAIMHKYTGPVFIKPAPMTFDELIKAVRENEARDLALTQVCGQEGKPGEITFTTYWERIPGVEFHIWFPGQPHADEQKQHFENNGYRLTYLCGYTEAGKGKYVGVWQKPTKSEAQYEAHYGLTMEACMQKDRLLVQKGFVATSLRVFNNKNQVLCTGIWENRNGRSNVQVGQNLEVMYSPIPVRFLKGSPELLSDDQMEFLIKRVEHFMKDLNIPGLSIAIAKKEQLKFAAGFGYTDIRQQEPVTPNHQFRVGSVSKPVTAAAIMLLIDKGHFTLESKLFGKDSIFGSEFSKKYQYPRYVTEITVRNLLEHTSGGWDNLQSDAAWVQPDMTTKELIEYVLTNVPLEYKPGSMWIYSNFGYQLLGYLIETTTGMSYEAFVKKNIFAPSGVYDIQVARPSISERAPREVVYYMSGNGLGFNPYEMLPPERIGPWGGWIASPIQLLMFMSRIDGFTNREDILRLGWSLNIMGFNGWQHDGRMPGSAAMLVRLDNGLEMAVTVNKEYSERDFFHELGYVLHHIGNNCDWWNDDYDLFQKSRRSSRSAKRHREAVQTTNTTNPHVIRFV